MWRSSLKVALVVAALAACERERVEVAESDGGSSPSGVDADPPLFGAGDGGADAQLATCGPPPVIGRCASCPSGYVSLADGAATCGCCP